MKTRALGVIGLGLVLFFCGQLVGSVNAAELRGEWTADKTRSKAGEIHFTFNRPSPKGGWNMSGETFKMADLQGVSAAQIEGATRTDINFTIVGDAGSFACEGMFREGRGTGFWTFAPSEAFRADMSRRGYGPLSDEDLMRAALNRLTRKYVDDLKAVGFDKVEYKELLRASGDGVTPGFIRDVRAAGFADATLAQFARAADNGVTAAFIREVRDAGSTLR